MLSPSRVLAAQAQSPAQLLMLQMLQSTGSFRMPRSAPVAVATAAPDTPPAPARPQKRARRLLNIQQEQSITALPLQVPLQPPLPPIRVVEDLHKAIAHLRTTDAVLKQHIDSVDQLPLKLLLKPDSSCFAAIAKSIVYQQLHGKAAAAIWSRLMTVCKVDPDAPLKELTPQALLSRPVDQLRGAGLSERKASYLQGLAQHFVEARLDDTTIRSLDDERLAEALLVVKGVGPWTVDMVSIFTLGRPDILPVGDLAVRKGVQVLYGLKSMPTPTEMQQVAESWRPWRSVGAWYMWQVVTTPASPSPKAAGRGKHKGTKKTP